MPTRTRPFFIVGTHRSGTTLLRVMLDSHPRLSVGPETNLLHHWFDGLDASSMESWPLPKQDLDLVLLDAFAQIHQRYMESHGKKRWGDKTPKYWKLIPRILAAWPQSQFIYLLRDGRDVVCSVRERWGWHLHYAARSWAREVDSALQLVEAHKGNVLLVRYEQLVADPRSTVGRVLDFLEEPWDETVVTPNAVGHDAFSQDSPRAVQPISESSVGRWRRDLNVFEQMLVTRLMRSSLARAGYL